MRTKQKKKKVNEARLEMTDGTLHHEVVPAASLGNVWNEEQVKVRETSHE